MRPLRVVLDEILAPTPNAVSRYARNLTRALITFAPPMCRVEGIVAASTETEYDRLAAQLPGLADLHKSALARREQNAAWQHGFTLSHGGGMLHSPSLLAPLWRRDRSRGHQTVVTIHDLLAWTHPETLTPKAVAWHKTMAKRAYNYADAVVVPTYTVAAQLNALFDFKDRLNIIAAAAGGELERDRAGERRLELPERYLFATTELDGVERLIAALGHQETGDLPLLVMGRDDDGTIADAVHTARLDKNRVRILGDLAPRDFAEAMQRAAAFVVPGMAVGFGMHVLEAFRVGTPVIHSDLPAITDIAADAGMPVAVDDADEHPQRLATAIGELVADSELATRLAITGRDRAGFFSWEVTADKIWRMHADL